MPKAIRHFFHFIKHENIDRLLLVIGALLAISTLSITYFEPNITLLNAFWWSIVTMTTVGYGDISPVTAGGRLVAVVTMFFGIGVLGMFSAIVASVLVEKKIKEDRGMHSANFENHIILCEWNYRSQHILDELRASPKTAETPIVLIAQTESKPVDDEYVFFVHGTANDETLERANLAQAKTVVVLGDDSLEATARDAKVVLNTLTIETINPQAYTIVEVIDEINAKHCERANADEIIISNELSSGLIARSIANHGMSKIVSELLSSQYGNHLHKDQVPANLVNKSFLEALSQMKEQHQCILVALETAQGQFIANPPSDYRLTASDILIMVAPGAKI